MIKSYKQMSWYKESRIQRKRDNLKKHIKSKRKRKAIREGWKWLDFGRSIKSSYANTVAREKASADLMKNYKGL